MWVAAGRPCGMVEAACCEGTGGLLEVIWDAVWEVLLDMTSEGVERLDGRGSGIMCCWIRGELEDATWPWAVVGTGP